MVKKVGHTATGQPSSPAAATLWTKSVESKGGISTAAGSSVNKIVHAWIGGACSGKLNVWAAIPYWGHMVKKWTKNKHLPLFNAQSFKPFNVQFQSHTLNKPLFKIPIYEQKSANRASRLFSSFFFRTLSRGSCLEPVLLTDHNDQQCAWQVVEGLPRLGTCTSLQIGKTGATENVPHAASPLPDLKSTFTNQLHPHPSPTQHPSPSGSASTVDHGTQRCGTLPDNRAKPTQASS